MSDYGTVTARGLLDKPGNLEDADIDVLNANSDKISLYAMGYFLCTSTTRPAAPWQGMEIHESDTKGIAYWESDTSEWVYSCGGPWQELAVAGGFSYNGPAFAVRRIGNEVQFRGGYILRTNTTLIIASGVVSTLWAAATGIPVGLRPTTTAIRQPGTYHLADAPLLGEVEILATGAIGFMPTGSGTIPVGGPGGIRFPNFSWFL